MKQLNVVNSKINAKSILMSTNLPLMEKISKNIINK